MGCTLKWRGMVYKIIVAEKNYGCYTYWRVLNDSAASFYAIG
jgi:hypothetical protein